MFGKIIPKQFSVQAEMKSQVNSPLDARFTSSIANAYITLNNTRNLFASIKFCSESTVVTGVGAVSPASTLDRVVYVGQIIYIRWLDLSFYILVYK